MSNSVSPLPSPVSDSRISSEALTLPNSNLANSNLVVPIRPSSEALNVPNAVPSTEQRTTAVAQLGLGGLPNSADNQLVPLAVFCDRQIAELTRKEEMVVDGEPRMKSVKLLQMMGTAGIPEEHLKIVKEILACYRNNDYLQLLMWKSGAAFLPDELYKGLIQVNRDIEASESAIEKNEEEIRKLNATSNAICCTIEKRNLRLTAITLLSLSAIAVAVLLSLGVNIDLQVLAKLAGTSLLGILVKTDVEQMLAMRDDSSKVQLAAAQTEQVKLRAARAELFHRAKTYADRVRTHAEKLSTELCHHFVDITPYRLRGSRKADLEYLFTPDAGRVQVFEVQEKLLTCFARQFEKNQNAFIQCVDDLVSIHDQRLSANPSHSRSSTGTSGSRDVVINLFPDAEARMEACLGARLCTELTRAVKLIALPTNPDRGVMETLSRGKAYLAVANARFQQENALDNIRTHFVKQLESPPISPNGEAQILCYQFPYSVGALANGRVHANGHQRMSTVLTSPLGANAGRRPSSSSQPERKADAVASTDRKDEGKRGQLAAPAATSANPATPRGKRATVAPVVPAKKGKNKNGKS